MISTSGCSALNPGRAQNISSSFPSPVISAHPSRAPLADLFGDSPTISALKDLATSIANRHSTVLITGETGTGKEMLARYIHGRSVRSSRLFVPVDCSALTDTLIESQLFGHVRGAFTGAIRDSVGFIRAAHEGTLFLDEIGELPVGMQAKLLRVIQERTVVPVGGNQAFAVDVRIICATHRNLSDMVQHRTFREDLYFRLNVIGVHVPPLRERSSDVLALGRHFLASQAAVYDEAPKLLSDAASEVLSAYHWPGNVRELANVMEHAHVLASGSVIQVTDLPSHLHPCQTTSTAMATASATLNIHQIERQTIVEALRRCEGNKAAAARMLGMNIQKLGRRMSRLSVDAPQVSLR